MVLGIQASAVEKVIYFAGYIVTKVSEDNRARLLKELDTEYKTKVKALQNEEAKEALRDRMEEMKREIQNVVTGVVLDELTFHRYSIKYSTLFEARIGAEAIYDLFKQVDLKELLARLEKDRDTAGALERAKLDKRLSLVRGMIHAGVRPEWMFLTRIPVVSLQRFVRWWRSKVDVTRHLTSTTLSSCDQP
jgi:DNA-directed RNA polymerase subunit beta'